jgi:hypothetical protein
MKTQGLTPGMHIGFANEFYTLWRVDAPNEYGQQDAYFCGNISKDKAVSSSKFPTLPFSALKGIYWAWEPKQPKDDGTAEVFMFGKYEGYQFETAPTSYIAWYWGETRNVNAFAALLRAGYVFVGDVLFESQEKADSFLNRKRVQNMLMQDGLHEVVFSSNFRAIYDDEKGEEFFTASFSCNDETHCSEFPYGQEITVETNDEIVWKSYKGYTFGTLKGKRSMKGVSAKIIIADNKVVEIFRF